MPKCKSKSQRLLKSQSKAHNNTTLLRATKRVTAKYRSKPHTKDKQHGTHRSKKQLKKEKTLRNGVLTKRRLIRNPSVSRLIGLCRSKPIGLNADKRQLENLVAKDLKKIQRGPTIDAFVGEPDADQRRDRGDRKTKTRTQLFGERASRRESVDGGGGGSERPDSSADPPQYCPANSTDSRQQTADSAVSDQTGASTSQQTKEPENHLWSHVVNKVRLQQRETQAAPSTPVAKSAAKPVEPGPLSKLSLLEIRDRILVLPRLRTRHKHGITNHVASQLQRQIFRRNIELREYFGGSAQQNIEEEENEEESFEKPGPSHRAPVSANERRQTTAHPRTSNMESCRKSSAGKRSNQFVWQPVGLDSSQHSSVQDESSPMRQALDPSSARMDGWQRQWLCRVNQRRSDRAQKVNQTFLLNMQQPPNNNASREQDSSGCSSVAAGGSRMSLSIGSADCSRLSRNRSHSRESGLLPARAAQHVVAQSEQRRAQQVCGLSQLSGHSHSERRSGSLSGLDHTAPFDLSKQNVSSEAYEAPIFGAGAVDQQQHRSAEHGSAIFQANDPPINLRFGSDRCEGDAAGAGSSQLQPFVLFNNHNSTQLTYDHNNTGGHPMFNF